MESINEQSEIVESDIVVEEKNPKEITSSSLVQPNSLQEEDTPVTRLRDFLLVLLAGFFQLFEKSVIYIFGIVIAIVSFLYLIFTILGF